MTKNEKVKALVDLFINEKYGATIDHFKIADVIDERRGSFQYRSIVDRAKKELLDSGKMIANVYKVGYRVVDPDEYVRQSARSVAIGTRAVDRGFHILENAPVKDMTQEGVRQYNVVTDRVRITQAALHGAKVEIKMLSEKRENPLRLGL